MADKKKKIIKLADETKPLIFDCKVCERCLRAMTAKQYWDHKCGGESNG